MIKMNIKEFTEKYPNKNKPEKSYFSPGRINLIGEHVDNYGGKVLPMSIHLGIYAFVSKRKDRKVTLSSTAFPKSDLTIDLDNLKKSSEGHWCNYAIGMMTELLDGSEMNGFDLTIHSTLPIGAGVSSSASLEVLVGTILNDLYTLGKTPLEIVKIAKYVENVYIGVACGILDQFAVGIGKKNHAMYLNTTTLKNKHIPVELEENIFVLVNTNKKRTLAGSEYNDRKNDCDKALLKINQSNFYNEIANIPLNKLEDISPILTDNELKRVTHVVTEEDRTLRFTTAIKAKNYALAGEILHECHNSLRDNFEVSWKEADILVELFKENGAHGSRMVGGGFGGCILALINKEIYNDVKEQIANAYNELTGYNADFYIVHSSDGAKKVEDLT